MGGLILSVILQYMVSASSLSCFLWLVKQHSHSNRCDMVLITRQHLVDCMGRLLCLFLSNSMLINNTHTAIGVNFIDRTAKRCTADNERSLNTSLVC